MPRDKTPRWQHLPKKKPADYASASQDRRAIIKGWLKQLPAAIALCVCAFTWLGIAITLGWGFIWPIIKLSWILFHATWAFFNPITQGPYNPPYSPIGYENNSNSLDFFVKHMLLFQENDAKTLAYVASYSKTSAPFLNLEFPFATEVPLESYDSVKKFQNSVGFCFDHWLRILYIYNRLPGPSIASVAMEWLNHWAYSLQSGWYPPAPKKIIPSSIDAFTFHLEAYEGLGDLKFQGLRTQGRGTAVEKQILLQALNFSRPRPLTIELHYCLALEFQKFPEEVAYFSHLCASCKQLCLLVAPQNMPHLILYGLFIFTRGLADSAFFLADCAVWLVDLVQKIPHFILYGLCALTRGLADCAVWLVDLVQKIPSLMVYGLFIFTRGLVNSAFFLADCAVWLVDLVQKIPSLMVYGLFIFTRGLVNSAFFLADCAVWLVDLVQKILHFMVDGLTRGLADLRGLSSLMQKPLVLGLILLRFIVVAFNYERLCAWTCLGLTPLLVWFQPGLLFPVFKLLVVAYALSQVFVAPLLKLALWAVIYLVAIPLHEIHCAVITGALFFYNLVYTLGIYLFSFVPGIVPQGLYDFFTSIFWFVTSPLSSAQVWALVCHLAYAWGLFTFFLLKVLIYLAAPLIFLLYFRVLSLALFLKFYYTKAFNLTWFILTYVFSLFWGLSTGLSGFLTFIFFLGFMLTLGLALATLRYTFKHLCNVEGALYLPSWIYSNYISFRVKFYYKFIRLYVEPFWNHLLWWAANLAVRNELRTSPTKVVQYEDIFEEAEVHLEMEAFLQCFVNVTCSSLRYMVTLKLRLLAQWVLQWSLRGPLAPYVSPWIYCYHLHTMGFRLYVDLDHYKRFWFIYARIRNIFYTLLNVDTFFSLGAIFGLPQVQNPPVQDMPEKPGVDIPKIHVNEDPLLFANVGYFRPLTLDNLLNPKDPEGHHWEEKRAEALERNQRWREWSNIFTKSIFFLFFYLIYGIVAFLFWLLLTLVPLAWRLNFYFFRAKREAIRLFFFLESSRLGTLGYAFLSIFYSPFKARPLKKHVPLVMASLYSCGMLLFFLLTRINVPLRFICVLLKYFFYLIIRLRLLWLFACLFFTLGSFVFCLTAVNLSFLFFTEFGTYVYELLFWSYNQRMSYSLVHMRLVPAYLLEEAIDRSWDLADFFLDYFMPGDLLYKTIYIWYLIYELLAIMKDFFLAGQPYKVYFLLHYGFHEAWLQFYYLVVHKPLEWIIPSYFFFLLSPLYKFPIFLLHWAKVVSTFLFFKIPFTETLWWYLLGSDSSIYMRWLLRYLYLDFFSIHHIQVLTEVLWHLFTDVIHAKFINKYIFFYMFTYPGTFLERWFFYRWTDLCFFFFGDILTGHAWRYVQMAKVYPYLDAFFLNSLSKPLDWWYSSTFHKQRFSLWRELVGWTRPWPPGESVGPILMHTHAPGLSCFSFFYEPYVSWTIRRSSLWVSHNTSHLFSRGVKKVGLSVFAMPFAQFVLLGCSLLVMFKGFRKLAFPSIEHWYSSQYAWTEFRADESDDFFSTLVDLDPKVILKYKHYVGAIELDGERFSSKERPWRYANLPELRLRGTRGTENFIEALSRYIDMTFQEPSQRLGLKHLVRRLWGSRSAEDFFSYIFRRRKGPAKKMHYDNVDYPVKFRLKDPEEAKEEFRTIDEIAHYRWEERKRAYHAAVAEGTKPPLSLEELKASAPWQYDPRILALGRELFGDPFCRFMENLKHDFLCIQREPQYKNWEEVQINDSTTCRFILDYIENPSEPGTYDSNVYLERAYQSDGYLNQEDSNPQMLDSHAYFYERSYEFIQSVLDYFAWLDSLLFSRKLPPWVAHKDHLMDLFAINWWEGNYYVDWVKAKDAYDATVAPELKYISHHKRFADINLWEPLFYWGIVPVLAAYLALVITIGGDDIYLKVLWMWYYDIELEHRATAMDLVSALFIDDLMGSLKHYVNWYNWYFDHSFMVGSQTWRRDADFGANFDSRYVEEMLWVQIDSISSPRRFTYSYTTEILFRERFAKMAEVGRRSGFLANYNLKRFGSVVYYLLEPLLPTSLGSSFRPYRYLSFIILAYIACGLIRAYVQEQRRYMYARFLLKFIYLRGNPGLMERPSRIPEISLLKENVARQYRQLEGLYSTKLFQWLSPLWMGTVRPKPCQRPLGVLADQPVDPHRRARAYQRLSDYFRAKAQFRRVHRNSTEEATRKLRKQIQRKQERSSRPRDELFPLKKMLKRFRESQQKKA